MEAYNISLVVHLLCAILFVGFIFADVVVFRGLRNKYTEEETQEIKETIYSRGVKIYPPAVLLLIGTGGYMFSKYINSTLGYFETNMQMLLWLKFFLVLCIIAGVAYALSCRFRGKQEAKFMKYFHLVALFLGIAITILAKVMFWV